MKLKSLFLEGFKVFAEPQTFDFTEYPEDGLCFVTGKNEVDPELGANGVGKSSVFDGLCVALYGKTSRGLKAGDVASWQVAHDLEDKAVEAEKAGKKRPSQKALTPSVTNRVVFENYNGDLCTINRRWNPNVLTLQINDKKPKNVDQKELDALIGYNFDEFLQAAYFSQFQDLFLDMSSTERSALIAKVLNLDVWDKYSEEAKRDADGIKKQVDEGRSGIERIKGQIEELEGQDFSEQIQEWEAEHKAELEGLKADLADHEGQEDAIKAAIEKATKTVEKARVELEKQQLEVEDRVAQETQPIRAERADALAKLELVLDNANNALTDLEDDESAINEPEGMAELEDNIASLEKQVIKHESTYDRNEDDIQALEKKEAKVKKLEGDCSACGQAITEEHVDHELEHLEKQIIDLEDANEAINEKIRKANRELRVAKKELKGLKDSIKESADAHKAKMRKAREEVKAANDDIKAKQREFDTRITKAEQEARKASQEVLSGLNSRVTEAEKALTEANASEKSWKRIRNDLRDDVLDCEEAVNPHKAQQEKNKKRLASLNTERETAFSELEKVVESEMASRYWVKGFKSVKLFAVSSALNELEAEVNSALDGLGLGGWSVEFDVDKETKKGTLSKGFFAFINSADNLEPVKWEAWSGGESQRLRLAASLGLANMIRASKGLELPFEIWDEPSQWMSDSGITGLLDVLQRRARRLKRQIWLIDHRGLEHPFDAAIEITKTYEGSTIKNVSQSFSGVGTRY
ncbi:MAG: hypothetical protein GY833_22165 [Aestuariibacter sp.]|nr:hypothetical protein [Aestuariibacter sp.]|tara:strand:- start:31565 stop:33826 length:2262 start_codon:yes stop_codon:yes gene_type:complete